MRCRPGHRRDLCREARPDRGGPQGHRGHRGDSREALHEAGQARDPRSGGQEARNLPPRPSRGLLPGLPALREARAAPAIGHQPFSRARVARPEGEAGQEAAVKSRFHGPGQGEAPCGARWLVAGRAPGHKGLRPHIEPGQGQRHRGGARGGRCPRGGHGGGCAPDMGFRAPGGVRS